MERPVPWYPGRDHFVRAQALWREEERRDPTCKYTSTPEQVEWVLITHFEQFVRSKRDIVRVCVWEPNGVEIMDRLVPIVVARGWIPEGPADSFSVNTNYQFRRARRWR